MNSNGENLAGLVRVIEIGATNVKKADVGLSKEFIINKKATQEVMRSIDALIGFVMADFNPKINQLCFAVAGPVKDQEIILTLPNIPSWPKNLKLARIFKDKINLPIKVFNDMELSVVGMAHLLKEKGINEPFWGITWSSGVGGKFWDGQKIFSASEVGHMTINNSNNAPVCSCGKKGHVSSYLEGFSLQRRIGKELSIVTDAFRQGENWAKEFYFEAAKNMGIFLGNLTQINFCKLICFKGGIAENLLEFPEIKNEILENTKKTVVSLEWAPTEIILSPEPEKDTFIGAIKVLEQQ